MASKLLIGTAVEKCQLRAVTQQLLRREAVHMRVLAAAALATSLPNRTTFFSCGWLGDATRTAQLWLTRIGCFVCMHSQVLRCAQH